MEKFCAVQPLELNTNCFEKNRFAQNKEPENNFNTSSKNDLPIIQQSKLYHIPGISRILKAWEFVELKSIGYIFSIILIINYLNVLMT